MEGETRLVGKFLSLLLYGWRALGHTRRAIDTTPFWAFRSVFYLTCLRIRGLLFPYGLSLIFGLLRIAAQLPSSFVLLLNYKYRPMNYIHDVDP